MDTAGTTEAEVVTHDRTYHVTFAHDITPRYPTPGRPHRRPEPSPCSTPDAARALAPMLGDPIGVTVSRYSLATEDRVRVEAVDLRHVTVAGDDWPALIEAARAANAAAGIKVRNRSRGKL